MRRRDHLLLSAGAALITAWVAHQLWRGAHLAQVQSFDPVLYGQGLHNFAHGLGHGTVIGAHPLAVHAHGGLLLLAPLARLLSACDALILGQSLALLATLLLFGYGAARLAAARALRWPGLIGLGALLTAAASPLTLNPFLFDARPDLLGVPLLLGGLVMARARRRFSAGAIALICLGVATREEFAMVAIPALLFTPAGLAKETRRARWLIAALLGIYWMSYINWGLDLFDSAAAYADKQGALATFMIGEEEGLLDELKILGVTLASLGGLAILGWRWLIPAIPGALLLLIDARLDVQILNTHYGMFLAPILLVAALDGLARGLDGAPRWRRVGGAAVVLLSAASFTFAGALPGGGLFRASYLDMLPAKPPKRPSMLTRSPAVEATHALLDQIPEGAGAVIPWQFAGARVDRAFLWTPQRLREALSEGEGPPEEAAWIALPQKDVADLGPRLVEGFGFDYVDSAPGMLFLLARHPAPFSAAERIARASLERCARPLQRWPEAGLSLCEVGRFRDGRTTAILKREAPPRPALEGAALSVFVDVGGRRVALRTLKGLFNPRQVPVGRAVRLLGAPLPSGEAWITLAAEGRPLEASGAARRPL